MEWFWSVPPDHYSIYLLGPSRSPSSEFWIAAFGALVGASAAFTLEAGRRMFQERRRRIAAGNLALLTMFRMWWEIYNYEKNIIREAVLKRSQQIPLWLRISVLARTPADLRFKADDLVFMLHTAEPTRLAATILQETRYHELFHAVIVRNAVLTSAQEKMAGKSVGVATDPTDNELIGAIGIPDIAKLRTLTLGIIQAVYKNLVDMRTEYDALRQLLVRKFGRRNIVAFALEPKFPGELETPSVEHWLIRLTMENNARPNSPPFSLAEGSPPS